jgi:hypothetical protein
MQGRLTLPAWMPLNGRLAYESSALFHSVINDYDVYSSTDNVIEEQTPVILRKMLT